MSDMGSANAPAYEEDRLGGVEPLDAVEEDLLVEDVSIDGMCGVY